MCVRRHHCHSFFFSYLISNFPIVWQNTAVHSIRFSSRENSSSISAVQKKNSNRTLRVINWHVNCNIRYAYVWSHVNCYLSTDGMTINNSRAANIKITRESYQNRDQWRCIDREDGYWCFDWFIRGHLIGLFVEIRVCVMKSSSFFYFFNIYMKEYLSLLDWEMRMRACALWLPLGGGMWMIQFSE